MLNYLYIDFIIQNIGEDFVSGENIKTVWKLQTTHIMYFYSRLRKAHISGNNIKILPSLYYLVYRKGAVIHPTFLLFRVTLTWARKVIMCQIKEQCKWPYLTHMGRWWKCLWWCMTCLICRPTPAHSSVSEHSTCLLGPVIPMPMLTSGSVTSYISGRYLLSAMYWTLLLLCIMVCYCNNHKPI